MVKELEYMMSFRESAPKLACCGPPSLGSANIISPLNSAAGCHISKMSKCHKISDLIDFSTSTSKGKSV